MSVLLIRACLCGCLCVCVGADAIQSVGVMIAAALIWWNPEWRLADPICTFLFSLLVLITTWRLIKQSIRVLMEGIPEGIDPEAVENTLAAIPDVAGAAFVLPFCSDSVCAALHCTAEVHDLHIWSLSVGKPSMSVHLTVKSHGRGVLQEATRLLAKRFNIHHTTIQVEQQHDEVHCNPHFRCARLLTACLL